MSGQDYHDWPGLQAGGYSPDNISGTGLGISASDPNQFDPNPIDTDPKDGGEAGVASQNDAGLPSALVGAGTWRIGHHRIDIDTKDPNVGIRWTDTRPTYDPITGKRLSIPGRYFQRHVDARTPDTHINADKGLFKDAISPYNNGHATDFEFLQGVLNLVTRRIPFPVPVPAILFDYDNPNSPSYYGGGEGMY